jgi:hypothetical protein
MQAGDTMKTDLYTKTVLTVIAACLMWICVNTLTPTVSAQKGAAQPMRVIIVDEEGNPLHTHQGFRVTLGAEPLPITVTNTFLPVMVGNSSLGVTVRSIERAGSWDPLQVQVLKDPPTLQPVP